MNVSEFYPKRLALHLRLTFDAFTGMELLFEIYIYIYSVFLDYSINHCI